MQRILAITLAANIFFLLRVVVEVSTSLLRASCFLCSMLTIIFGMYPIYIQVCIVITLAIHFLSTKHFLLDESHSLWLKCILSKHWLEVAIIALELLVSTSVSSNSRASINSHSHATRHSTSGSENQRR